MSKYKHIFFDLDHTLWDFETNSKHTLLNLLSKYELDKNISSEKFIEDYWVHNKRLWDAYEKSEIDQKTLRFERFNLSLKDQGLLDARLAEIMSQEYLALLPFRKNLMNGAKDVLDYLKPNYVLHLITNGFEKTQRNKLHHSSLGHYFEEIITSEKSNSVKPQKAIFDFALQVTGASINESIMIGDNPDADIQGAINVGMDSVYVNHTNKPIDISPTYTIYHLKELEEIL